MRTDTHRSVHIENVIIKKYLITSTNIYVVNLKHIYVCKCVSITQKKN